MDSVCKLKMIQTAVAITKRGKIFDTARPHTEGIQGSWIGPLIRSAGYVHDRGHKGCRLMTWYMTIPS